MSVTVEKTGAQHIQHGDHRSISAYYDDYAGTVNGKSFEVRINPLAAPAWGSDELDDDDKADVLNAIENARETANA